MELNDLYRDVILDHNRRPRNFGSLDPADASVEGFNPLCGDRLTVQLNMSGERIADIRFDGQGCAISTASASLMTEAVKGRTRAEALQLFERVHQLLTDDAAPSDELGKLAALSGVREFPARVKCASLCWHTLSSALRSAQPGAIAGRFHRVSQNAMHSYENEPIVVQRDVKAVAIPAGVEVNLKLGSVGYITQALGGSFTVYIDGNLFRIAGQEADAIGKTAAIAPEVPPGASEEDIKSIIWEQLRTCYDPEIPVNIVDLGLIYACDVNKNDDATRTVAIKMTLTAPGCGMGEVLVRDVRDKVEIVPTVAKADVELVFDPPWNHSMMSDAARLQTGMM